MAVVNEKSTQVTAIDAGTKLDTGTLAGRLRVAYFEHTQAAIGAITSDIELVKLPAGKVRLLGRMSEAYVNWVTAAMTLDVGWAAYEDEDGTAVVADPNGLADGIDVELAGYQTLVTLPVASGGTKVFQSRNGVTLLATAEDVALAVGDTIAGYFVYVVD